MTDNARNGAPASPYSTPLPPPARPSRKLAIASLVIAGTGVLLLIFAAPLPGLSLTFALASSVLSIVCLADSKPGTKYFVTALCLSAVIYLGTVARVILAVVDALRFWFGWFT